MKNYMGGRENLTGQHFKWVEIKYDMQFMNNYFIVNLKSVITRQSMALSLSLKLMKFLNWGQWEMHYDGIILCN